MTAPIWKLTNSSSSYNIYGRRHGFLKRISPFTSRYAKFRVRTSSNLAVANSSNTNMVSTSTVLWMMATLMTFTFSMNLSTKTRQKICPMHCRLLHMFPNLRDSGHQCKMDNLFNSVNLACAEYHRQTASEYQVTAGTGVLMALKHE